VTAKERRPALDGLMADARRRAFDAVAVFRFDRFARSVAHLARALDEFRALGIEFVSLHEAVDTSPPMGRAMFHIAGAFAELEREIIRERVRPPGLSRPGCSCVKDQAHHEDPHKYSEHEFDDPLVCHFPRFPGSYQRVVVVIIPVNVNHHSLPVRTRPSRSSLV
jgi:hypothetical protein